MKVKPFMLGLWEFRRMLTTYPGEGNLAAYEWGREWGHRLTMHRYDHIVKNPMASTDMIALQTARVALEMNEGLRDGIAPNRIVQIARLQNNTTEKLLLDVLNVVVEHRKKEAEETETKNTNRKER